MFLRVIPETQIPKFYREQSQVSDSVSGIDLGLNRRVELQVIIFFYHPFM